MAYTSWLHRILSHSRRYTMSHLSHASPRPPGTQHHLSSKPSYHGRAALLNTTHITATTTYLASVRHPLRSCSSQHSMHARDFPLSIARSTSGQQSEANARNYSTTREYPTHARVGIGIVVFRRSPTQPTETQVLLIKRGREPSKGLWSVPGGSLELGESMVECAVREVLEETGIKVRNAAQPGLRLVWSSSLAFPTAFTAADLIERSSEADSRIKYHYCIVELAALAQDPTQEPIAGDDAEAAVWLNVKQLRDLPGLSEGIDQLTREAMRIFDVPALLRGSTTSSDQSS